MDAQFFSSFRDEVVSIRRDIHMNPELGFQENRTAALVEAYLQNCGIPTQRMAGTGVIGTLEGAVPGLSLIHI